MKSPYHPRDIMQKVFFKFNLLFLLLTCQTIYKYPGLTWGKTEHNKTFDKNLALNIKNKYFYNSIL